MLTSVNATIWNTGNQYMGHAHFLIGVTCTHQYCPKWHNVKQITTLFLCQ